MKNGLIYLFFLLISMIACDRVSSNKTVDRVDIIKEKIIDEPRSKHTVWKSLSDSVKIELASELSKYYRKKKDSSNFYLWNSHFLYLSQINGNSIETAEAYWDRANFNEYTSHLDSSYFYFIKAFEIFEGFGDQKHAASMLYSAGVVQRNLKDYIGGEVTTIDAIRIYENLNDNRGLYKCCNSLGIIHNNLNNFELSLSYHSIALEKAKEMSDLNLIAASKNNLAVVYREHHDYEESVRLAKEGLQWDSIYQKDRELYARLVDNLAYSQFKLKKTGKEIFDALEDARAIRDSLGDESGLSVSNIHIGEYHIENGNIFRAKAILRDELIHAKKNSSASDLIHALDLLGQIDPENSQKYLQRRIAISDSLIDIERKTQNKFARTQYETNKVITNNEQLASEKKLIIISGIIGIFLVSLIYFLNMQRIRVKKLRLERAQVKSNEEIYQLLISQQNHLEEGRRLEKNRMSKELHDSVLGKLFGIRFLLTSLNGQQGEAIEKQREQYLKDLENTEEEIREISHGLRDNNEVLKTSFYQIIQNFLEERKAIYSFNISLSIKTGTFDLNEIPISYKINIFRILQEAIFNVEKYAKATGAKVSINVGKDEKYITLKVEDNGVGFDVDTVRKGIGLTNIKERTQEMRGSFNITSVPSQTIVKIIIPIHYES